MNICSRTIDQAYGNAGFLPTVCVFVLISLTDPIQVVVTGAKLDRYNEP